MRWSGIAVAWVLCAAVTGCVSTGAASGEYNFLANSFRNLGEWPVLGTVECRRSLRDCARAKEAWRATQAACPGQRYSRDYACGFKAGFCDYLDAGGDGQPPAVPPFRYRLAGYDSPAGHQAIEDWYAGFRHGAFVARASGLRELSVTPLSAPPLDAVVEAAGPGVAPGPAALSFGPGATPSPDAPPLEVVPDQLPPPRIVLPPVPGPSPGGPGR
jgi:hypothetical protein